MYWINPNPNEPTRATVNFHIGGYVVKDIRIINGEKGEFVLMPSYKNSNGKYIDIFHPTTAQDREQMNSLVMKAYRQKLAEQAQGETYVAAKEVSEVDVAEQSVSNSPYSQVM